MLGKVMKYEFKSCGRLLLPFFGLAILLSCVARGLQFVAPLLWQPLGNFLNSFAMMVGILVMIAVILLCIVYLVVRFYQGMVSNEAYLTFTLPVSANTHIIGRLLVGTIYSMASFLVAFVSALILIPGFWDILAKPGVYMRAVGNLGVSQGRFSVPASVWASGAGLVVVTLLLSVAGSLLMFYAAMAAGRSISRNRALGGVAAYLLLNAVEGVLTLPLVFPLMNIFGKTDAEMAAYFKSLPVEDLSQSLHNIIGAVWLFAGILLAINLVFAVAHYLICRHYFGKQLNLE